MNIINHYINLHQFINEEYNQILNYDYNYITEVYQTPERIQLADITKLNKIRIGTDPRKCTLRLILPSVNIGKIVYKLANEICGHYKKKFDKPTKSDLKYNRKPYLRVNQLSWDGGKVHEVLNGVHTSLRSRVIQKSNVIEIYIWNVWDKEAEERIIKYYEQDKRSSYYKSRYEDMIDAKKKFDEEAKKVVTSNTITIDFSKDRIKEINTSEAFGQVAMSNDSLSDRRVREKIKKSNPELFKCWQFVNTFWNTVFDLIVVCIGYARGQYFVKYVRNTPTAHSGEVTANTEKIVRTPKSMSEYARYFHSDGPYAAGLQTVLEEIEKKYKISFRDIDKDY